MSTLYSAVRFGFGTRDAVVGGNRGISCRDPDASAALRNRSQLPAWTGCWFKDSTVNRQRCLPREPLFSYGRCLAHFAVDPELVSGPHTARRGEDTLPAVQSGQVRRRRESADTADARRIRH